MAKKLISKKVAREKYGIVVKRYHDYKYYLLDNGNVVDSDGDVRYQAPVKNQKIEIFMDEIELEEMLHEEGTEFNWTFPTDKGEQIDVLIRREREEDYEITKD